MFWNINLVSSSTAGLLILQTDIILLRPVLSVRWTGLLKFEEIYDKNINYILINLIRNQNPFVALIDRNVRAQKTWRPICQYLPGRVKRNSAFEHVQMRRRRSYCACAKYNPGLCSPFVCSVISNGSVMGQWRPWSDCADAQADLGLLCPHMPKDMFSHCAVLLK